VVSVARGVHPAAAAALAQPRLPLFMTVEVCALHVSVSGVGGLRVMLWYVLARAAWRLPLVLPHEHTAALVALVAVQLSPVYSWWLLPVVQFKVD
jgi:hypothetical protein